MRLCNTFSFHFPLNGFSDKGSVVHKTQVKGLQLYEKSLLRGIVLTGSHTALVKVWEN